MVAQQLTPELTQPNVLVEIDHGPTMGAYQETQRRVPRECLAESMSITNDASVSTSTFSPAIVDRRPGYDATALTGMRSHGTKVEALKGGSVGRIESCLTTHCSKSGHTILDTGKETAFIGMHLLQFMKDDNEQGAEPSPIAEKPISGWSFPEGEGNSPLNSFELAHAVVPSLPVKEKDWAKPISARRCPQRGLAQDRLSASRDPESLLFLTDQDGTVSRDCASEYRHRSFNGNSNVDNEPVIHEKKMAGDDKAAVVGKSNNTVDIRTGRLQETQSMAQENTDDVKPPFSMSGPTGAKTAVNVDAGCIASEILMWMVEYNLVSYSAQ